MNNSIYIVIIFFICAIKLHSQDYMIKNGDTLPYKLEIFEIKGEDTFYTAPCQTFSLKGDMIINRRNAKCHPIGYWEIETDSGTIIKGNYNIRSEHIGIWRTYNQNGNLILEEEDIYGFGDIITVYRAKYIDGEKIIEINKPKLYKFLLKYSILWFVLILSLFTIKIILNLIIYSNKKVKYNFILLCFLILFSFWFYTKNKPDKQLRKVNNILSIIFIFLFIGLLIYLNLHGGGFS